MHEFDHADRQNNFPAESVICQGKRGPKLTPQTNHAVCWAN